jgi:hypothetical protein
MSPRIIHIPLSGGDRKAQAKGIRYAHGIHNNPLFEFARCRSGASADPFILDHHVCGQNQISTLATAMSALAQ